MANESLNPFPLGLRVFLRSQNSDGSLHFIDFPTARAITRQDGTAPIAVHDAEGLFLGSFIESAVAAFIPLAPAVASDAKN